MRLGRAARANDKTTQKLVAFVLDVVPNVTRFCDPLLSQTARQFFFAPFLARRLPSKVLIA